MRGPDVRSKLFGAPPPPETDETAASDRVQALIGHSGDSLLF
jgi:hypothetical protein